jgi:cyclic-di-GMP phosphodiesterase TipF (flagellum assembly factor)
MLRLGALFVVFCMVLIAAAVGAVLFLLVGLTASESAIVAVAVLTALAIHNTVSARLRDRSDLGAQIADMSRGTADLARQVAEIGRRTSALEGRAEKFANDAAEQARAATDPVIVELGELGTLVKQLAESVAVHELKLAAANAPAAVERPAAKPPRPVETENLADAAVFEDGPEPAAAASAASAAERSRGRTTEIVREALEANRFDLYLQPIVTLPQRKVRFYESFTWLRSGDGDHLQPDQFVDAAEAAGLMPRIDNVLLLRSVQVIRRLQLKNRDVGLFCGLSMATLNDARTFPQMLQFMDANRALAPSFVLEFRQSALRAMGPLETEGLAALRELGFRFCMDELTDLRMDPRDLGERGIRYVKVPAPLLLGQAGAARPDIHAADLSDLLGRYGISLIAERIDTDSQVVELLEYDVRFGQGALFSPPRPVRAEALRGAADAATPSWDGADKKRDQAAAGRSPGIAL